MTENTKLSIRLDLEGELARKFEKIKREKGIANNTDVIRLLITETYNELESQVAEIQHKLEKVKK
jgi:hypothetical protein